MADVIDFPKKINIGDLPVEVVLEGTKASELEHVLIVARLTDGHYYFAATNWNKDYIADLINALVEEIGLG